MGADQIGYLVKGPRKINPARIKAAARACLKTRAAILKDVSDNANRGERQEAAYALTSEYFDPEDIPENPEQAIREWIEWWTHQDSRDTCSRSDPDNPRQQLVYAGEMSWGDEPSGRGYQMLKKAFAWGFAEALGIR